jgi:hypothetical protein
VTQNVQNLKDTHSHCKRKNERKIIDLVEEKEALEVRLDRVGEGSGRVRAMLAAAIAAAAAAAALTYLRPSLPLLNTHTHTLTQSSRGQKKSQISLSPPSFLPSFLPSCLPACLQLLGLPYQKMLTHSSLCEKRGFIR